MNKKAAYIWISWVLLFAFAVALSAVMYNWIFGYTQSSAEQLQRRADANECQFVGINVDSACQEPKSLSMVLSNRNNLNIDKVIVKFYNIYGEPMDPLIEKQVDINPGSTERVVVAKSAAVSRVEVIPVTYTEKFQISCREKIAGTNNVPMQENC